MTAKVEIKLESTPTSPIPNVNKRSSPNENKQDQQVQAIVHILGNILLKATNDIINKKGDFFCINLIRLSCSRLHDFFFNFMIYSHFRKLCTLFGRYYVFIP